MPHTFAKSLTLAITHGPISQERFLTDMGLQLRVDGLRRAAKSEERRRELEDSANRLIDPIGMGKEYQVLGITSTGAQGKGVESVWPFPSKVPY